MALNKGNLAKDIEAVLNSVLPPVAMEKDSGIKKQNKKIGKGIADAVDKYIKEASVDISGIQMLPGTQIMVNPGIATAGSPAAQTSVSPGSGMTTAPAELNPGTAIDCCKVY